jgi:HEAT repeat protein
MPARLEERLGYLKRLRSNEAGVEVEPLLRKGLQDRSNLIVAEAAKIAAERRCAGLIPDLLAALSRLFENPVKTDPRCWGKTSVVRALTVLDHSEAAPFLRAATHIQMEPVYGGQEDSAIHLRGTAILALIQSNDLTRQEILRHLVDALADTSDTVRIEAVRALEQMNGEEPAVLLRLKAHAGDKRPAVAGQVFDSLLVLDRERAVEFVARFLRFSSPEIRDEAALSLGASRLPAAVKALLDAWDGSRGGDFKSVLLRGLSSSRDETALTFLLKLVRDGTSRDAAVALEALDLHRDSPEIWKRVEEAKRTRATADGP